MRHRGLTRIGLVVGIALPVEAQGHTILGAAQEGDVAETEQHVRDGPSVNARDTLGKTPMHMAAARGHRDVAELLLAKGARATAKPPSGCGH